ncbi:NAD-dependent epimerase/dehydratase family protein [Phytohabitans sp. ZYX-F-186]|uniref:UDP-glucose 4-epimerase n=1 Tax=Phytohabitans maris TaxID=3071409 RepID=A0ABU0ZUX9_9ACTN|nr:NAD-dependent epimerase/dehydratase family protein [Phytohabitans sp. ZYX-F-186]MDQ7910748.1 NAD-dependent epimerase/dehydratase family protein [Phytohabitans sp. ZYX-F-186]
MRVLVTGGQGYLGHAVCHALGAAGHQVAVLGRRTGVDVRDRGTVAEFVRGVRPDAVCHLAALTRARDSFADPLAFFDVNVGGTLNLLLALDRPVPFVLASSSIVYGGRQTGALGEDLPPNPESPYAASKVAAEQMVAAHAATGAVGGVILRCFNISGAVAGVGDADPTRIIPNVFRAITGELPHVTLNGDGSATRDFVHITDVAQAVTSAVDRARPGESQTYNIGSGTGTSMAAIIEAAEVVTGRRVPVKHNPPKPEPAHLIADIARARAGLDWEPRHSTPDRILNDAWAVWTAP